MSRAALFLDRDGTLIRHIHYLHKPEEVELLPDIAEALKRAKALGYLLFLHTNQSGVGRGMFTLRDVHACNQRMLKLLDLGPDIFTDKCIAPEAPDEPMIYRKPSPRFAQEMAAKHGLELKKCWMVGDYPADVETAFAAGMQAAALVGGPITEVEIAQWRSVGREVILYPSLAALVATLSQA
jgi:D-glycero-D-manno-heptose 1,7-bisphosphate phosphatase